MGATDVPPHHAGRRIATASWRAWLLLALLTAWWPALPAVAQLAPGTEDPPAIGSGNPFTQVGVPAEATAENGVLARERALAAGRRTAWGRLAAELGLSSAPAISDSQLEAMVASIVIEQERVTPTRYSGRITVNFNASRARGALGSRAAAAPSGVPQADPAAAAPPRPTGPASVWLDTFASYRSLEEWLELQRRLRQAGAVASVQVQAVAVDRARLRLGLRSPGGLAAEELAGLGVILAPRAADGAPDQAWRVGLAGGG